MDLRNVDIPVPRVELGITVIRRVLPPECRCGGLWRWYHTCYSEQINSLVDAYACKTCGAHERVLNAGPLPETYVDERTNQRLVTPPRTGDGG